MHCRRVVVLASVVAGRAHREDDVRADHPDEPDVVGRDLVLAPLLERLVDAERVAEIHGAREVLFRAVEPMERRKFLRAQHAERFENFGADLVLPAVSPCGRGERRPEALSPIEHDQQPVVLVVGMGRRFHHDARVGEVPQSEPERRMPLELVDGYDPHLRARKRHEERGEGDRPE